MGRQRFAVLAVMALCLLPIAAAMASSPAAAQQVTYPTAVLPGLAAPATIAATLSRPDGPGPFPAVIVLHDCSGVSRKDQDWAKRLVSWGYVAIQPDSLRPKISQIARLRPIVASWPRLR